MFFKIIEYENNLAETGEVVWDGFSASVCDEVYEYYTSESTGQIYTIERGGEEVERSIFIGP